MSSKTDPQIFKHADSSLRLYRDAPTWDGKACAAIGDFNIQNEASGIALIQAVNVEIKSESFHAILGPMNGDTWHSYRAVTQSDNSSPFMLEPISGPYDFLALQKTGFKAVSHYVSNRAALKDTLSSAPVTIEGVTIAPWNGKNGEALVDHIFAMSEGSFAKNNFFKPINIDAFRAMYIPLLSALDPRFVLIATHHSGKICGFLFGFPDQSAPKDNPTIILKTYASGLRGVGYALADYFHRAALDIGFKSVIHALMHEDNASLKSSHQHNSVTFRRYALLARIL